MAGAAPNQKQQPLQVSAAPISALALPSQRRSSNASSSRSSKSTAQLRRLVLLAPFCAFVVGWTSLALFTNSTEYLFSFSNGTDTPSAVASTKTAATAITSSSSSSTASSTVWLAGIVRDASTDIRPDVLRQLVTLNCQYGVAIHIVARTGVKECSSSVDQLQQQQQQNDDQPTTTCAPFYVVEEPPDLFQTSSLSSVTNTTTSSSSTSNITNRIDKIALVRDYQRSLLRPLLHDATAFAQNEEVVIMIADLDLYSLPDTSVWTEQVKALQRRTASAIVNTNNTTTADADANYDKDDVDVICAAGIMHRPYGYYDIFATVLLPNTFVYPLRGRLSVNDNSLYPDEDARLVRSNEVYGNFTQWDLLTHLQHQAQDSQGYGYVPVRSCFGGLALYKASVWLEPNCRYYIDMNASDNTTNNTFNNDAALDLQRYATKVSERPCEHVVFHECLRRTQGIVGGKERTSTTTNGSNTTMKHNRHDLKIAVQPRLQTQWNAPIVFDNTLRPANRHLSLGVFRNHVQHADRLVVVSNNASHNNNATTSYALYINATGSLVVVAEEQRWQHNDDPGQETKHENKTVVVWSHHDYKEGNTALSASSTLMDYWTHMYLQLLPNGRLQLVQQVPKHGMVDRKEYANYCAPRRRRSTRSRRHRRHGHDGDTTGKQQKQQGDAKDASSASSFCECDTKNDHCKVVVWQTLNTINGTSSNDEKMLDTNPNDDKDKNAAASAGDDDGEDQSSAVVLILRDNGLLDVVDQATDTIVWTNGIRV